MKLLLTFALLVLAAVCLADSEPLPVRRSLASARDRRDHSSRGPVAKAVTPVAKKLKKLRVKKPVKKTKGVHSLRHKRSSDLARSVSYAPYNSYGGGVGTPAAGLGAVLELLNPSRFAVAAVDFMSTAFGGLAGWADGMLKKIGIDTHGALQPKTLQEYFKKQSGGLWVMGAATIAIGVFTLFNTLLSLAGLASQVLQLLGSAKGKVHHLLRSDADALEQTALDHADRIARMVESIDDLLPEEEL